MKRLSFAHVALLTAVVAASGCREQQQCAPGDTPAVCKGVQECLASGTSIEVCREAERDANQPRKSLAPATSGTADALSYDPLKASQKPVPKPQPKQ
jgi:uncharacterized protein YgiB involved in biofilm formation